MHSRFEILRWAWDSYKNLKFHYNVLRLFPVFYNFWLIKRWNDIIILGLRNYLVIRIFFSMIIFLSHILQDFNKKNHGKKQYNYVSLFFKPKGSVWQVTEENNTDLAWIASLRDHNTMFVRIFYILIWPMCILV